jgi:hypothetical protein
MSVSLLAGAGVAALTASLLADRYRLIAGIVGANVAAAMGYGGIWVLTALDGCVPGMSTFLSACDWRPVVAWKSFRYRLGILLVLVAVEGIVSAAAVSAVRRAFRRPTRPAAAPRKGQEHRGLRNRRLAAGGLCAGAIGMSAAVLFLPGPSGSASTVSAARPITHPRFTAGEAAIQAEAWYGMGGRDLMVRYGKNLNRLLALGPEAQRSSDGDALIRSRLPAICAEFGKIAEDAEAYFPVPAPRLLPSWTTFTTRAARGSEVCLTGLRQNDAVLLAAGIKELNLATRAADTINGWVIAGRTARP